MGNITCFCNYKICWWWSLNGLWLVCVEWMKYFFLSCSRVWYFFLNLFYECLSFSSYSEIPISITNVTFLFFFFFHLELQESKLKFPLICKRFAQKYLIWNCSPFWRLVKEKVKFIILDPFVDLIIMICIVVNTCFMALEHPDMTLTFKDMIYTSDKVS